MSGSKPPARTNQRGGYSTRDPPPPECASGSRNNLKRKLKHSWSHGLFDRFSSSKWSSHSAKPFVFSGASLELGASWMLIALQLVTP